MNEIVFQSKVEKTLWFTEHTFTLAPLNNIIGDQTYNLLNPRLLQITIGDFGQTRVYIVTLAKSKYTLKTKFFNGVEGTFNIRNYGI